MVPEELMSVADWIPIAARAVASDRKLKAGDVLFRRGGKPLGLYEIIAGSVRLTRVDRVGHEIVLHVAAPGELLAEASLFSSQYHCDAIASTDATIRLYPKRELLAALEENPKAMKAFAGNLAQLVMTLRTRLEQRNIRSAHERVRHFLSLTAGADSRTIEWRGTLKNLAAELGLTHEALYRTLADLEGSGEIRRKGKAITLLRRV